MAELVIPGLKPGTGYSVQLRSIGEKVNSPWTNTFVFITAAVTLHPAAPTNVSFVPVGTSFSGTWTAPTTNEDGTPLLDLKDYQITFLANTYTHIVYTTSPSYTLAIDDNKAFFGGTASGNISVTVKARNNAGLLSAGAVTTAVKPPPNPPTNVTASGISGGLSISWTGSTSDDVNHYEVYASTTSGFTPGSANKVWSGNATNAIYNTLTTSNFYVIVAAVDSLNDPGYAAQIGPVKIIDPFYVDNVAPPPVSNFRATGTGLVDPTGRLSYVDLAWNTITGTTDLAGYRIKYSTSAGGTPTLIDVGTDTNTLRVTSLAAGQNYYFSIASYDFTANVSAYTAALVSPYQAQPNNSAPSAPTGLNAIGGATSITAFWTENSEATVAYGQGQYELQLDTVDTFNSANYRSIKTSALVQTISGLQTNGVTYSLRLRAISSSGVPGPFSAIVHVSTATSLGIIPATTLDGSAIAAGTLAGDRVVANTLDANVLKANTAFNQNLTVASVFTLGTSAGGAGNIKSYDYDGSTLGFQLNSNGLDVRNGTIAAKALQIQDSQNIMPIEYAGFEIRPDALAGKIETGGGVNAVINTATARFNTQSLQFTAASYVYLAPTSAQASGNISVDPNTTYIFSWYAYCSGAVTMSPVARRNSSGDIGGPTSTITTGWVRYWYSFTTGASDTLVGMFWNTSGGGTGYIDGVQLERQQGSLTTPSQFKPPGTTTIDGGLIKTGAIQSTATTGGQPNWSITLNGAATFANAQVNGSLVVSNSASYMIQSFGYSPGSAGWAIRGDGYAEFRNVRVAGDISGSTGNFNGSLTVGGGYGFHVDTSGNLWVGGPTYGDANSLFKVASNGVLTATSANISGSVTANQVSTGGFTIYSDGRASSSYLSWTNTGVLTANSATLNGNFTVGGGSTGTFFVNGNGIMIGSSTPSLANFFVDSGGNLFAKGNANFTGNINSGSIISGATIQGGIIQTQVPNNARIELGASVTGAQQGYSSLKFYGANAGASGIEGNQDNLLMYSSDGTTCRLNMAGSAGVAGQFGFYLNNALFMGINSSGISIPGDKPISHGTSTGVKYNLLNDGSYSIGVQNYTHFFRTGNGFAWYLGGSFSTGQNDPGGGTTQMRLDSSGNLYVHGTGNFSQSTRRVKKNISTLSENRGLNFIDSLRPVKYDRKDTEAVNQVGFIAEDVAEIEPALVMFAEEDGSALAVNYAGFTPYTVLAIQQLSSKVKELESKISQLTRK